MPSNLDNHCEATWKSLYPGDPGFCMEEATHRVSLHGHSQTQKACLHHVIVLAEDNLETGSKRLVITAL